MRHVHVRLWFAALLLLLSVQFPARPQAASWTVHSGDNLQAIINSAALGDTITLDADAIFTGPITLPNKTGSGTLTIISGGTLPGSTTRVSPTTALHFAKIRTTSTEPAVQTAPYAHGYALVGIELYSTATLTYDLIRLGDGSNAQNTLTMVPTALILDRMYIHGTTTDGAKRGVALNSATTTVKNSYISEIWTIGQDTQAIGGWNGPGPYTITNNYLEAAGENFLLGGSDPAIPNLIPTGVTFTGNYVSRPLAWRARTGMNVKNLLELKNAQDVTITGNIFENHWVDAQGGYAIVFTGRSQDCLAPWSIVQRVTFSNNVLRHISGGINLLGQDYRCTPATVSNTFTIAHNLVYDLSPATYGGGRGDFLLVNGGTDITLNHNTVISEGSSTIYGDTNPSVRFTLTNNIFPYNLYGIMGGGTSPGNGTLATFFPNATVSRNVIWGAPAWIFPTNNYYPADAAGVGFRDYSGGQYGLATGSSFHNLALDGIDPGAIIANLPTDAGLPITTPPVSPFTMTCPGPISGTAATSTGALTVTYAAPVLSGGTGSKSASCNPASGSSFASGTTTVACTGNDSGSPVQTASCSFPVTINAPAPTISCPANLTATSPGTSSVSVTYDAPLAAGGATPLTTTCSPASGTSFAVGTQAVSCTTTDTLLRTATCGFTVTVQATVVPETGGVNPPAAPYKPSPFTGATRVSVQPTLTWKADTAGATYDVYFSDSGNAPGLVASGLTTPYLPMPRLAAATTYTWRVVVRTATGALTGSAWTFTTR